MSTQPHSQNLTPASIDLPLARVDGFVGREKEIEFIESKLFQSTRGSKVAIYGLGGVGKTRVAIEIAHCIRQRDPGRPILWVQAMDLWTFEKSYMEIARQFNITGIDVEGADVKHLVKQHLSKTTTCKWFMVLDNADNTAIWGPKSKQDTGDISLSEFLPTSNNGSILVTTRNRHVAVQIASRNIISLSELKEDQAIELLTSLVLNSSNVDLSDANSELVEKLTYLPLAIVQAAAYINMNDASVNDYLEILGGEENDAIEVLSEHFEDESRYDETCNPVAATWLVSFNEMQAHRPRAAEFLAFLSCLNEQNIPHSLLPETKSKKELVEIVGYLTGYSFLRKDQNQDTAEPLYHMHRLVRLATRNWLREQGKLDEQVELAIKLVASRFPFRDSENRDLCALYMPHAQILSSQTFSEEFNERYKLLDRLRRCLLSDGRFHEAVELDEIILRRHKKVLGDEDHDTLLAYNSLGASLYFNGEYLRAKTVLEEARDLEQRVLGTKHPRTVFCMGLLANVYQKLGRLEDAENLQKELIDIQREVFGPEARETVHEMAGLTWTLNLQQQRLDEAEELGSKVFKLASKSLHEEDEVFLESVTNLADIYDQLNRHEEAAELATKAHRVRMRHLGPDHPSTLITMSNLAVYYHSMSRFSEAEELGERVWRTSKEVLGTSHPLTLNRAFCYGRTLIQLGREEAEELWTDIVDQHLKTFGPLEVRTLRSMAYLASSLRHLGRLEKAIDVMKRCIEGCIRTLGFHDTQTQVYMLNWSDELKFSEEDWLSSTSIAVELPSDRAPITDVSKGHCTQ